MSTPAVSQAVSQAETVKFPDENHSIEYMNEHPMTKTGCSTNLHAKIKFESLAKWFANKEMPRNEIQKNVKTCMAEEMKNMAEEMKKTKTYVNDSRQQLYNLETSVVDLMNKTGMNMNDCLSEPFRVTMIVCEHLLSDLADKATYAPPLDGQTNWVKLS